MAREPIGKVTPADLSIRDKGMTGVEAKTSRVSLVARAPLSLTDLLGSTPYRGGLAYAHHNYTKMAETPLYGFSVTREGPNQPDGEEFIIVGPRATAEDVNALLYFAAPYKFFGLDTDDIINDWTALYNGATENERLRTAHATMPGWSTFEQSRTLILDVLKRDYPASYSSFLNQHPDDVIIPTVHGTRDAEGNITLSIEPLDDELRGLIVEQLPQYITDPERLDVGMGSVFVAAYSPDNAKWPQYSGYTNSNAGKTQPIGPTQVLAFAIRRLAERQAKVDLVPDNQDIQQSWMLAGFTDYLRTGDKPAAIVTDTELGLSTDTAKPLPIPTPQNFNLLAAYITQVAPKPTLGGNIFESLGKQMNPDPEVTIFPKINNEKNPVTLILKPQENKLPKMEKNYPPGIIYSNDDETII